MAIVQCPLDKMPRIALFEIITILCELNDLVQTHCNLLSLKTRAHVSKPIQIRHEPGRIASETCVRAYQINTHKLLYLYFQITLTVCVYLLSSEFVLKGLCYYQRIKTKVILKKKLRRMFMTWKNIEILFIIATDISIDEKFTFYRELVMRSEVFS